MKKKDLANCFTFTVSNDSINTAIIDAQINSTSTETIELGKGTPTHIIGLSDKAIE